MTVHQGIALGEGVRDSLSQEVSFKRGQNDRKDKLKTGGGLCPAEETVSAKAVGAGQAQGLGKWKDMNLEGSEPGRGVPESCQGSGPNPLGPLECSTKSQK